MAIYAFDFDEVAKTRQDLDEVANNLESNLSKCKGNLNSELSNWQGAASNKYDNTTEQNYNTIVQDIDTIRGMSSYLGEVARVIEATEDDLSSIEI